MIMGTIGSDFEAFKTTKRLEKMAHPQETISFEENIPTQINVPPGTFYSFLLRTGAKPPPNHKSFLPNVPVRLFGTG